jgi:hypothetical protein
VARMQRDAPPPTTHQHELLAVQPVLVHGVGRQLQPGAARAHCYRRGLLLSCQLHHQLGQRALALHRRRWRLHWRRQAVAAGDAARGVSGERGEWVGLCRNFCTIRERTAPLFPSRRH